VIETLNVYLGIQADVIRQYGGYVDKFVGDEIMALFEGENKEARAVRAADAMLKAVRDANAIDRMAIGIGVNAGEVVFGSTGSTGRQDYTVIGDVVNMAARLCSAAAAGVVLVSEDVQHAACDIASFSTPESLKLKGKSKALPIYTLLEVHPDHLGGEGIDSGVSDNE
jgi:adenylate cyclase